MLYRVCPLDSVGIDHADTTEPRAPHRISMIELAWVGNPSAAIDNECQTPSQPSATSAHAAFSAFIYRLTAVR